jgi:hypothetical protein
MYKTGSQMFVLGVLLLFGCAGQTKTNTTYDEKAESSDVAAEHEVAAEYEMPEPPKVKADDLERSRTTE